MDPKKHVVGTCRLCRTDEVELRESHVISKWAYRRARSETKGHEDPVRMHGGVALHTSNQFMDRLLCGNCEQVIGNSERYVSSLAFPRTGVAPLLAAMVGRVQWLRDEHGYAAGLASLEGFDVDHLIRFGASLIWRAHEAAADSGGTVRLRDRTAESLRQYLLRSAAFPVDVQLLLVVLDPGNSVVERALCSLVTSAASDRQGEITSHGIIIHGLAYFLHEDHRGFLGEPPRLGMLTTIPPHCMIARPTRVGLVRNTVAEHGRSRPTGKLAKRT